MATNWTRRDFLALTGGAGRRLPVAGAERPPARCRRRPLRPGWALVPDILARIVPPTFPRARFPGDDVRRGRRRQDRLHRRVPRRHRRLPRCGRRPRGRPRGIIPHRRHPTQEQRQSPPRLAGTTILFSRDPRHYLPARLHALGGHRVHELLAVHLRLRGAEHRRHRRRARSTARRRRALVAVEGRRGRWPGAPNQNAARARLIEMGAKGVPVAERVFGEGSYLRPELHPAVPLPERAHRRRDDPQLADVGDPPGALRAT